MSKSKIVFLICTLLAIIVWIVSDAMNIRPSVEVSPKLQQAKQPIDPKFDQATLDEIEARVTTPLDKFSIDSSALVATNSSKLPKIQP